jgi:hypothetical protein
MRFPRVTGGSLEGRHLGEEHKRLRVSVIHILLVLAGFCTQDRGQAAAGEGSWMASTATAAAAACREGAGRIEAGAGWCHGPPASWRANSVGSGERRGAGTSVTVSPSLPAVAAYLLRSMGSTV